MAVELAFFGFNQSNKLIQGEYFKKRRSASTGYIGIAPKNKKVESH